MSPSVDTFKIHNPDVIKARTDLETGARQISNVYWIELSMCGWPSFSRYLYNGYKSVAVK